ncbi:MAG: hypothetical protein PF447_07555, partial [Spirochaetaceae bacterium]|nr:hypothetical protein [Spirochaetaceae bacterium]
DGTNESVSGDDLLTVSGDELVIFSDSGDNLLRTGVVTAYLPGYTFWSDKAADTAYLSQVQVGDLTGDGCAEIVVVDFTRSYLRIYRYNSNTQDVDYIDNAFSDMGGIGSSPYLCLPDIDEDGMVLEYVGHSLEYSNPFVIAVLSAPPYWDLTDDAGNPIQNYDGNGTSFWIESGVSAGTSFSLSVSNGVTIGGKASIPVISNGEVEVSRSLTTTLSTAFDLSAEMVMEYELTSDPRADYVIFSACPIDIYLYEVIQVEPGNEDGLEVGDYVNMTFARDASTNMTTVDFYNQNNGTYQDIDDTVLNHTVGNPGTYPSKDWVNENRIRTNPLSYLLENVSKGIVPQLSASNTISYANSTSADVSFSCEIEISESKEVSFGALFGTEQSITVGFSATIGATIGSGISGTVGGLNNPYYGNPDYMYNWGIYSYFQDSSDSLLPYTVVDYWCDL